MAIEPAHPPSLGSNAEVARRSSQTLRRPAAHSGRAAGASADRG